MIYDVAVIGTGPAGVSAALTLKANGKQFVFIGSGKLSDKVGKAEKISNYPGLSQVTGEEMNEAFRRQLEELDIKIEDRMVNSVMNFGGHYALMAGDEFYEANSIILATGVAAVGTIPGETELVGRGVSYCATCDGGLYRGKTIAVLSTNKRFEHEVKYLSKLAEKVYFLPAYKDSEIGEENVTVLPSPIVGLREADNRLSGITLKNGDEIEVKGLFCLRDSVSLKTLLPGLNTSDGHIAVDRNMATNLPGCFAAGDCTGRPYQYVKAAGEGNVAAHSAVEYLATIEK